MSRGFRIVRVIVVDPRRKRVDEQDAYEYTEYSTLSFPSYLYHYIIRTTLALLRTVIQQFPYTSDDDAVDDVLTTRKRGAL